MADDKKPQNTPSPRPSNDSRDGGSHHRSDDSSGRIQTNKDTTIMESRPTPRPGPKK